MAWEGKTPYVDEKCIGCGACAAICSDVFEMDDETGKSIVVEGKNTSNSEGIDDAIAACPVDAIHYKD